MYPESNGTIVMDGCNHLLSFVVCSCLIVTLSSEELTQKSDRKITTSSVRLEDCGIMFRKRCHEGPSRVIGQEGYLGPQPVGRYIMKAVITVLGSDKIGIIAGVTAILAETGVNILDISQTIMQDIFTMIMMVDISTLTTDFGTLQERLMDKGHQMGVEIRVQRDDIFRSMHRI